MGTHPIFESDFDCLTDMNRKTSNCGFGLIIDDLLALWANYDDKKDQMDKEAKFVTFLVFTFLISILLASIALGTELISISTITLSSRNSSFASPIPIFNPFHSSEF